MALSATVFTSLLNRFKISPAAVFIQLKPVRINDFLKDVQLDILINTQADFGRDPGQKTGKQKVQHG